MDAHAGLRAFRRETRNTKGRQLGAAALRILTESFRGARRANLRCAIAHRGISRFRVRCGACHRAALRADPLASPGMTESGSLPLRNDFKLKSTYEFPFPRRAAPELCIYLPPPIEGVGNAGCPLHPRPRVHFYW